MEATIKESLDSVSLLQIRWCVTAAYATITYRLKVEMTRLLAAAFWLRVRNR
jgi:hypothetical protein